MSDHWSDVYVDLLRSAFPQDVGARPIYLSTPAELGDEWALSGAAAYTSTWLDWHTKPQLEAAGRWKGPGFAVVVCRDWFLQGDMPDVLGRLTHELAHAIIGSRSSIKRMACDVDPALGPEYAAKVETAAEVEKAFRDFELPKWSCHEADFIRVALHLHQRLWERGHWTTPAAMFIAGDLYGVSSGKAYRERLIDELKSEIETPIAELLATPAPEGFTALWKADTSRE
jgi:hypothetical protein